MFTAEFFPYLESPRLITAEDMLETHDDLRDKTKLELPETLPRISGDIITLKGMGEFNLFLLDSIRRGMGFVPGGMSLEKVAKMLLTQNLLPIDAECCIIDPHNL